jgi:hypothetical protein
MARKVADMRGRGADERSGGPAWRLAVMLALLCWLSGCRAEPFPRPIYFDASIFGGDGGDAGEAP